MSTTTYLRIYLRTGGGPLFLTRLEFRAKQMARLSPDRRYAPSQNMDFAHAAASTVILDNLEKQLRTAGLYNKDDNSSRRAT